MTIELISDGYASPAAFRSAMLAALAPLGTGDSLIYHAHQTLTQAVTDTAIPLILDTVTHNPNSLTVVSGEVSGFAPGTYLVEADVTLVAIAGTSRTQADAWIEDGGAELPGTRGTTYVRQSGFGATATLSAVVADPGVLRVVAQRTAGVSNTQASADGSRLRIWLLV